MGWTARRRPRASPRARRSVRRLVASAPSSTSPSTASAPPIRGCRDEIKRLLFRTTDRSITLPARTPATPPPSLPQPSVQPPEVAPATARSQFVPSAGASLPLLSSHPDARLRPAPLCPFHRSTPPAFSALRAPPPRIEAAGVTCHRCILPSPAAFLCSPCRTAHRLRQRRRPLPSPPHPDVALCPRPVTTNSPGDHFLTSSPPPDFAGDFPGSTQG